MLRAILHTIVRILFKLLGHVEAEGLENVPSQGGAILAANHLGLVDPPLVLTLLERDDVTSLVADKHQKNPFFRWLVNAVNGIWINREQADIKALREAYQFLKKGGLLGIAPEGTRSRAGVLMPAKTGVAYLADKAGVPVVPIAIAGTEKVFSELFRFRRPRLKVRIGRPFTLPPLDRRDRSASLQRNTDEIMCRIAALLPPDYRGAYADHPRLRELLALQYCSTDLCPFQIV